MKMEERFKDSALSPKERAEDLLPRLTLREKVGQVNQKLYGFQSYTCNGEHVELADSFKEEVEKWGGLGVLYGLYRADPWANKDYTTGLTGVNAIRAYNLAQRYVLEHSRFGIPMLMSSECPHGHQALGGGLLPVNLAAGATFDPALLSEGYKACGKQLKSGHVELALMSALDMARDPRWGRNKEGYGEDPVLTGKMAGAYIEGMQGDDPKYLRCASTLKHFYGNNTEVGRGWKNSSIDPRNKYELYLEPFRRCIEESGAEGIMTAYNRINGTVGGMVRENMEISESVIMKQADQKMYENKKSSR